MNLWNVTKWGLFFNIVSLVVHTLLPSALPYLDPTVGNSYQQQIWRHNMNFSTHKLFSLSSYIYIYIYIYYIYIYESGPKNLSAEKFIWNNDKTCPPHIRIYIYIYIYISSTPPDIFMTVCARMCVFIIDWLLRYVKQYRVILCLEDKESHSLYVHIYIYCADVYEVVFYCTPSYRIWIIIKEIYLSHRWKH